MRRRWLIGIASLAAVLVSLAGVVVHAVGGLDLAVAGAAPVQDGGSLAELAERLLAPNVPGPDGRLMTLQLLPGQVAAGLPVDVPVPAGGRIVGSVVRQSGSSVVNGDVIIDAPLSASETLAFFEQALAARGWTKNALNKGGAPGGFQPRLTVTFTSFCKGASGPFLNVSIASRSSAPTDVRLHVETTQPGPCTNPPAPPPPMPDSNTLPPLHAPDDVTLQINGGGGGPNRWISEATAETDRSAADLEAHFAKQLESAGWKRTAGSSTSPLAWSTWKLPREGNRTGFLFALEAPGQHRRTLYVRAEDANASGPQGWSSYSAAGGVMIAPTPQAQPPSPPAAPSVSVQPAPKPTPAVPSTR